jgi:hypothetical protein
MSALYSYGIAASLQMLLPMLLLAMTWLFLPEFLTPLLVLSPKTLRPAIIAL